MPLCGYHPDCLCRVGRVVRMPAQGNDIKRVKVNKRLSFRTILMPCVPDGAHLQVCLCLPLTVRRV